MKVRCWGFASVLLSLGCGQPEAVEKPTPPDMVDVVAGYDELNLDVVEPLDEEDVLELLAAQQSRLDHFCGYASGAETCAAIDLAENLVDTITRGGLGQGGDAPANAIVIGGAEFDADGYFRLTRVCEGHGGAPDADTNGAIHLTGTFSAERIDPVIWGEFTQCRTPLPGQADLWDIDGRVHLYTEIPDFQDLSQLSPPDFLNFLVLQIDGSIGAEGDVLEVSDDIALDADKNIRLRVSEAELGHFVLVLGVDGIALRGSDGEFRCDLELLGCEKVVR